MSAVAAGAGLSVDDNTRFATRNGDSRIEPCRRETAYCLGSMSAV